MDNNKNKISVLMSVYKNDNVTYLYRAVSSILNQTLPPDEIVLVIDGPVNEELEAQIEAYEKNQLFKIVRLPKNVGLGLALKTGLEVCSYSIIARMDSDDVALPTRFEKQLGFLISNPTIDIVGSDISEFIGEETNIVSYRRVPTDDQSIKKEMKYRCALNHMTVMLRKEAVLKAGSYQELFWNEDYYLWIRMLLNGAVFANIAEPLVNVRIGKEMFARRGGYPYFKSEHFLQRLMLKSGMINIGDYIMNTAKRFIVQLVLPNSLRAYVFKKFARK
ncbi:glycosyltransferase [Streptococcus ovuberis]|uniref:Glycosyltransferase n=1 Tax=Streptococcus ovuberis TaxID=1936207 RepID=A0A7X6RZT9_9STRE|nr:glycosyltransferase [Streptococcus ovuberis]NKZ19384.1 glycosyltransferase [Streptococcus ovuberis]